MLSTVTQSFIYATNLVQRSRAQALLYNSSGTWWVRVTKWQLQLTNCVGTKRQSKHRQNRWRIEGERGKWDSCPQPISWFLPIFFTKHICHDLGPPSPNLRSRSDSDQKNKQGKRKCAQFLACRTSYGRWAWPSRKSWKTFPSPGLATIWSKSVHHSGINSVITWCKKLTVCHGRLYHIYKATNTQYDAEQS